MTSADLEIGPDILYHYTNGPGFLGILTSRSIWATHGFCLNDSSEFRYTFKLVETMFPSDGGLAPEVAHELVALSRRFAFNVPYVASFSAADDILEQWRAYTRPGPSFAIGFSFPSLENLGKRAGLTLRACIYEAAAQRDMIREALKRSKELTDGLRSQTHLASAFTLRLQELACFFKDPAFHHEAEWRLFTQYPRRDLVRFRAGRSFMVPFTPLDLSPDEGGMPICDVVVGPTPNPEVALLTTGQVLDSFGCHLSEGRLRLSAVPFRDW